MPDETVDLIATKAYPYGRIKVAAGERFTAPARDAGLLVSIGLATRAPVMVAPTPEPEKPKARTKTRGLKAEEPQPVEPKPVDDAPEQAAPEDMAADSPKPKRDYFRRDLTPEE